MEREVIKVSTDDDGNYNISATQGTSAAEIAFCVSCVAKVLDRDNVISKDNFMELVNKYLTDEQYDEIEYEKLEETENAD